MGTTDIETDRYLRLAVEASDDAVIGVDLEGRVHTWNPAAERMFGYPADEARGSAVLDLVIPEELAEEAGELLDRALAGERIRRFETRRRTKRGEAIPVALHLLPARDDDGEVTGVCALVRDISHRERAAEQLRFQARLLRREAHQALRESEERFRLAFEEGPLGIALVRQDHTVLRANRALCEMLEYPEGELIGRSILDLTHPADVERERRLSRQVLRGEIPRFSLEKRYLTRSRQARWARLTATAVHDDSGRVRYGLAMIEEITERKQAEELVRRSERLASIGTFATGIAHQINNPLGGILMAAQFALGSRDRPDAAEILEQSLEEIEADARRCAEIVRSVLRFARQETLEKKPCRLDDVVRSALSLTRKHTPGKADVVLREPRRPGPELLASRTDLEQAVANVVQNALESADGDDVRVVVSLACNERYARVTVEDDGRGIPEEHQQFIFDPFYTTRRDHGGTGLGLSMAHAVVTAHGGTIDLETVPGHGTTVTMELPLGQVGEEADDA